MMDQLSQEVRYGWRQLWKYPAFSAVVILTLAVGIGAGTALFSVVDAVLLRPLPYSSPQNLVSIRTQSPEQHLMQFPASEPEFLAVRQESKVYKDVAAYASLAANLTGGEYPERVLATYATANLFSLLGVNPAVGRAFNAQEDRPGQEPVVILSHGLWVRRYGASLDIVGSQIPLNGKPRTVLGIMPADFRFPTEETDIWLPLGIDVVNPDGAASHYLSMIGRLKEGATLAAARTEASALLERWGREMDGSHRLNRNHPLELVLYSEVVTGNVRQPLWILFGAVGFVLLIICSNISGLMLARNTGRKREVAIRCAIGANRLRVLRQFLVESLLLAIVGGVAGVALALWGIDLLRVLVQDFVPRQNEIEINAGVLAFAAAMSMFCGLLFGIAPIQRYLGLNLSDSLKSGGRASEPSRRGRIFVAAEVALAMILLAGAGLLLRSYQQLQRIDPGFQVENILTLQVSLPRSKYPETHQVAGFYRDIAAKIAALPGVESAGAISKLPLESPPPPEDIQIEGRMPTPEDPPFNADLQLVSGNYFQTMKIPAVAGRIFSDSDRNAPSAIINQTLANLLWKGSNPLGQRIKLGGPHSHGSWLPIVGVVRDVKQNTLDAASRPEVYVPVEQGDQFQILLRSAAFTVRAGMDTDAVIAGVRKTIQEHDRDLPIYKVSTMREVTRVSLSRPRLASMLLAFFAGLALLLSAVGVYGLVSHLVAQKKRDIGIRMALGAAKQDVLRWVIGRGAFPVLIGVAAGLGCTVAMSRLLSGLLFEVQPNDPWALFAGAVVLIVAAGIACLIPARRATRVDASDLLRSE